MSMSDTGLHIFARAPVAGKAKTRLIPALGAQGAAELHAWLVRYTLANALSADVGPVTLWCASDMRHPFFMQCAFDFGVVLREQQGEDLGQRMSHALQSGLSESRSVLLIGTDCPDMTPEDLRHAAKWVSEDVPIVFIPAKDGGYALVGAQRTVPPIFDDIPWGGDQVMAVTRRRLESLALDWHELPPLADIDTPDDLLRLQQAHPELLIALNRLEISS